MWSKYLSNIVWRDFSLPVSACGPNTYQIERLLSSSVSISNGNIRYLIEKSIFTVNLTLKLIPAIITNAQTCSVGTDHGYGYGYGYEAMGMGTGTGSRPWVWVQVRVRDHGYGYGYGYDM